MARVEWWLLVEEGRVWWAPSLGRDQAGVGCRCEKALELGEETRVQLAGRRT